jgi:N-acetylglucosaminylphosphatidylinositol deacetylase
MGRIPTLSACVPTLTSIFIFVGPPFLTLLLSGALFLLIRWLTASPAGSSPLPPRALLVIAHPDDEAMFFSPALAHFGPTASILCLTAGCAGGDSGVRRGELAASAAALGVSTGRVMVCAHPRVRDGMKETWDGDAAAALVAAEVRRARPSLVLTFDSGGVTGHVNHAAACRAVLRAAVGGGAAWPATYALRTVPLHRRFLCGGLEAAGAAWGGARGAPPRREAPYPSLLLLCAQGAWPWARAHAAMCAHASQYVWHRRLWVAFSAYTFVNVLDRVA